MRSKELADLAGVTVRTLRHYHQMDLVARTPARRKRIPVLRSARSGPGAAHQAPGVARHAAAAGEAYAGVQSSEQEASSLSSGEPQDDAAPAVSGAAASGSASADVLAALDTELAAQIERLQEQRRVIAELRERWIDPDVPPAFGPHIARLREAGTSAQVVEAELSGLLLADRLLESESDEAASIEQFFALLEKSDAVERYAELNESLYRVPADASDAVLARLADELVAFMVPLLESGCAQYGWDLSQESIEAMAASSALADACASGTPHVSSSGVSSESAACKTGGSHCHDADASGLFRTVESERARAIFDMYDHEALNEAQRKVSELVVEGVLERLMKKG